MDADVVCQGDSSSASPPSVFGFQLISNSPPSPLVSPLRTPKSLLSAQLRCSRGSAALSSTCDEDGSEDDACSTTSSMLDDEDVDAYYGNSSQPAFSSKSRVSAFSEQPLPVLFPMAAQPAARAQAGSGKGAGHSTPSAAARPINIPETT